MDSKLIASTNQAAKSLDDEWALMIAALERVGMAAKEKPLPARRSGRLIVALDLTGSRESGLIEARIATAQMFTAIRTIGSVAVKMIYWRGLNELRATKWHDDAAALIDAMKKLSCETGETQIARVLGLALEEKEKLSGVVLIVDHCEEFHGGLRELARKLGQKVVPLFVFHECADDNSRSLQAKPVFKDMAEASHGVYVEFRPDSGAVLREVLSNVAAFSAAGHEGLKQVAAVKTPEARQLQKRLLMLPAAKD